MKIYSMLFLIKMKKEFWKIAIPSVLSCIFLIFIIVSMANPEMFFVEIKVKGYFKDYDYTSNEYWLCIENASLYNAGMWKNNCGEKFWFSEIDNNISLDNYLGHDVEISFKASYQSSIITSIAYVQK